MARPHKRKSCAGTILVLEDRTVIVELLELILGPRGYEVVGVSDPDAALAAVRAGEPALVLVNQRVFHGRGESPRELLREFLRKVATPWLLIPQGGSPTLHLELAEEMGARGCLGIPGMPTEIAETVERNVQSMGSLDRAVTALG